MANLTIVASEFAALNVPLYERTTLVDVVPGNVVYLTNPGRQWQLAQCDGTELEAELWGLAAVTAKAGQLCPVIAGGVITLGATAAPVAGTLYVVSNTAGLMMPTADLSTTGWYSSLAGIGGASNTLWVVPFASGETVP